MVRQTVTHKLYSSQPSFFSVFQKHQRLLTSQRWWTHPHTRRLVISADQRLCCPACPLRTSRSACDTWTPSPVQRSPRITCGWSTVRAKSPNPTGVVIFCFCIFRRRKPSIFYLSRSIFQNISVIHLYILFALPRLCSSRGVQLRAASLFTGWGAGVFAPGGV